MFVIGDVFVFMFVCLFVCVHLFCLIVSFFFLLTGPFFPSRGEERLIALGFFFV